ncbi:cell division protein SepF [Bacillaceae bacterium Marseille-Q3522]|nr:cell division protein SepF [Bacillaceae bacterium Marseille-Q3522]
MSIKSKIKTLFFLDDEYDDKEEEISEEEHAPSVKQQKAPLKQNIVSLQSVQKSSKVILTEPRAYEDSQEIADQLKNRRAVVVNLQRIEREQAKRIVDFLSGTVYAIGGDIQKLGTDIFLCTPDNVEVSGSISQILKDQDIEQSRW